MLREAHEVVLEAADGRGGNGKAAPTGAGGTGGARAVGGKLSWGDGFGRHFVCSDLRNTTEGGWSLKSGAGNWLIGKGLAS